MKFFCDRCKTRYSIGDDRVRGKILKIRCKNCANVITVREGMADPDGVGAESPAQRGRPTTGSPSASMSKNALGAAFAQQMTTKPPAALEEEWYVSIEGQQSGPFSLGEAQKWVAAKPYDADLHCWSEGFDDWLPVDKVSHFRGLRKRPERPTAPPPIPRGVPASSRSGRVAALAATPQPPAEPEPKPLFAATMAALERSDKSAPQRANGTGSLASLPTPTAPALPRAVPVQAKAPLPGPTRSGSGPMPSLSKMSSGPGVAATRSALAEAFDLGTAEPGTNVDEQPFDDNLATMAAPPPEHAALPKPIAGDDDMEIGEVSRVVNLADLAKTAKPRPRNNATGSVPRIPIGELSAASAASSMRSTGTNPAFGMTGPFQPIASESVVAAAPAREHRRGLVIMLVVAAVLLAGGVAAVVLILGNDNGDESGTLAHSVQYDTNRPDDMPRPKNAIEAVTQGAQIAQQQQQHQKLPQHNQQIHYPNQPEVPETPGDPTKSKIKPEEIEDIANKNAEGTKRCYMRAQKGTLGIDVAEIKRIDVLFTLDPTGTVSTVSLSDHANDQFGQCLIARVKGWKFRASPGGQFKFPLVFAN